MRGRILASLAIEGVRMMMARLGKVPSIFLTVTGMPTRVTTSIIRSSISSIATSVITAAVRRVVLVTAGTMGAVCATIVCDIRSGC